MMVYNDQQLGLVNAGLIITLQKYNNLFRIIKFSLFFMKKNK